MSIFRRIIAPTILAATGSLAATAADTSWTGFSAGLDLGYGQYESTITDIDYDYYGGTQVWRDEGLLFGLRGGYDHQFGSLVVGGELNWKLMSFESGERYSDDINVTNEASMLITLRARAGLAVDNSLIYLVFGFSQGDFSHNWDDDGSPNNSTNVDNENIGTVMGIGLEHMVTDKISIRAELVSYEFAEETGKTPNGDNYDFGDQVVAFTVGGSYHF